MREVGLDRRETLLRILLQDSETFVQAVAEGGVRSGGAQRGHGANRGATGAGAQRELAGQGGDFSVFQVVEIPFRVPALLPETNGNKSTLTRKTTKD